MAKAKSWELDSSDSLLYQMKKRKTPKTPTEKAKDELYDLSHTFIRKRDSINDYEIKGYCFDCGKLDSGQFFQAGHWIPDSVGGALLRYHPHNLHGQSAGCNCYFNQEQVKINYTLKMLEKYGIDYVNKLKALKQKSIKADILFYLKLIELYKNKDENKIVEYLESLA